MPDSIEIRLDQLTQAVKGLYAKSSMSQGEIYNALTNLSQRYENLTNVNSEKIAATLTNEFRKTIDAKYGQTNQYVKDLENSLKNLMQNVQNQNPKMASEITKILNDTSNTYAKLNSQEMALERIFSAIEMQTNSPETQDEIRKLSENFIGFTHGFENITNTLNKNFAEFLTQVQQSNPKEQISNISIALERVMADIGAVNSGIAAIDTKFKDFVSLLNASKEHENLFTNALNEIRLLSNSLNAVKEAINSSDARADIQAMGSEVKNNIEKVRFEIQKIASEATNDDIVQEIKGLATSVSGMGAEIKDVRSLINDEILYKNHQLDNEFEKYTNNVKTEIQNLLVGLGAFKEDVSQINQGNIKILQEPIERALAELSDKDIGKNIKELSENIKGVTDSINASIQGLQESVNDVNSTSKLDEVRQTFSNIRNELQESLGEIVRRIEEETKANRNETLDDLKINLQKFSDHISDTVDSVNGKINQELAAFKADYQGTNTRQVDSIEQISDRLSNIEINLENISAQETPQVSFEDLKNDIIESIADIDRSNKIALSEFQTKIDKVLDNYLGADIDNINQTKSLKDTIAEVGAKIDRTNLQQIHNAKELLEEIQANAANLLVKITEAQGENKDTTELDEAISKLSQKLQDIEQANVDLGDEVSDLKEQLDSKLKEAVQKIANVIKDVPEEGEEKDEDEEAQRAANLITLSNKIQEYLSNFEFLKNNLSQEITEGVVSEFSRIEDAIRKLRTNEPDSNYNYTLEDVESDLAKLRVTIEKSSLNSDELKNVLEKMVEIKTLSVENAKLNRDIEVELGHLSGWCKDNISRFNDISERLDEIQHHGFEDIKSRIVQSEKSKINTSELAQKMENAFKIVLRDIKAQEVKVDELTKKLEYMNQSQTESFNPAQFIDIFYDNMTQTKMLSNRVEIIEDKVNAIQNAVERLLSYVEQP